METFHMSIKAHKQREPLFPTVAFFEDLKRQGVITTSTLHCHQTA